MMYPQPIEHENRRILTTQQLAEYYAIDTNTLTQNYKRNKGRYKKGKHYFFLKGDELKAFLDMTKCHSQNGSKIRSLYLWTDRGAALHAKSLNTDKAWDKYEELVDFYFDVQLQLTPQLRRPSDWLEAHGVIHRALPEPTDEDIAREFLQKIEDALRSGEYYLLPKRAHVRGTRSGILLGIYDDEVITLISSLACEIYAGKSKTNRYQIGQLRRRLTAAGLAVLRNKKNQGHVKGPRDRTVTVIHLHRPSINAISGFSPLALPA
ncbi:MAG: ORF6N domain-containing protein [Synergistaceae bacterium]|nr:ORF6N domain-containing protein [Synergistaceae bacterium]